MTCIFSLCSIVEHKMQSETLSTSMMSTTTTTSTAPQPAQRATKASEAISSPDSSLARQKWFEEVYKSNLPSLPANSVYFWIKEDVFSPSLPGKVHLSLSSMRFKSRAGKEASLAVVNVGEGFYCQPGNNKPDRIYIPFEIQVRFSYFLRSRIHDSRP